MITSFECCETEGLWQGLRSQKLPESIQAVARRKLRMLYNAKTLADLQVPLGDRLETLMGARLGQHSIRIDDRWRICFEWTQEGSANVEIVEYPS